MGVKNLWRLLLPVGHRLSIETLSHQTLAIDASIWLTQVSKACRDPETGKLLPNKPHVRIFLLRLMRLLYHQIKPVVVFDGVMPEVKRREIQRRRDRRERLWRGDDDDNGDGSGGGGALRRTAKKILVKQLKEIREKEAKLKKKGTHSPRKTAEKKEADDKAGGAPASQSSNSGGAFAAGFTIAEDDAADDTIEAPNTKQSSDFDIDQADATKLKSGESDDVISIHSDDSREQAKQQFKSQLGQFKTEHAKDQEDGEQCESDNDWEMSHAVQSSINESIQQQSGTSYYNPNNDNPFDNEFYHRADNETIAALPTEARSQWVDSQKAERRIQSRQECIKAAANPEDYSGAQLRNFLKGSKLNKRVGEIDKLVEKRRDEDETPVGAVAGHVDAVVRNTQQRPVLRRVRRHKDSNNHNDDSDEENEMFSSTDGAQQRGAASMKVLFGDDDSDDEDDDGGGGFLLPSSNANDTAQSTNNEKGVVLLDDESKGKCCAPQSSDDDASLASNRSNREASTNIESSFDLKHNISYNNAPTTAAEDTTPIVSSHQSKMLELSTAGQEWEQWGHNEDSDNASEGKVESCKPAATMDMSKIDTTMGASESESDDDCDFGGSFLMLGQASKLAPSVPTKSVEGNTFEAQVNTSSEHNDDSNACKADDDEEEVNWEDGDSGTGQDTDGVDWEDGDSCGDVAENASGDVDIKDRGTSLDTIHEISNRGSDNAVLKENGNCSNRSKQPEQVDSKDAKGEVVELPSEDDTSLQFAAGAPAKNAVTAYPLSNPKKVGEEEEPLMANHDNNNLDQNEFDSFHPDNETTVALQHAQETASRLTSWAGRAFQRAMAAHVGQQPGSPSKKESPRKEEIDLTMNEDAIDVDEISNNEDSTSSSEKALDVNETNSNDVGGNDSPEQPRPQRRSDLFDTSLEGLNEAHDAIMEEEKAMERDMDTITDEMKDDILKLLVLCGIPWIESPSEAEAQCAALEELGLVDGVVTEDSDVFVFGGRKVYKNFFNEQKYVEAYFAKDIERDLALKKHQLVALAMLLGGDYTDGVKGVGIVNGMELLQAWPISDSADGVRDGLQAFKTWLDSFDEPSDNINNRTTASKQWLFHKKHKSARTRWVAPADFPSQAIINAYLKPAVDKSDAQFTWAKPNLHGLQQFCAETLGWEREETENVVNPVLKVLQNGSRQTRLESYFMRYEDNVTFAQVKSKRLKAVLKNIQGGDDAEDFHLEAVGEDERNTVPSEMNSELQPKKKKQK